MTMIKHLDDYSVRSKKVYSDLVDERAFLQDIKEYWVEKLKDLKACCT